MIKFSIYDINTLPEHYTQGKDFVLAPFFSKSADFYEIIRPKGTEKQAVSHRNGPEKQAVSLRNTSIIEFGTVTEFTSHNCNYNKEGVNTQINMFAASLFGVASKY